MKPTVEDLIAAARSYGEARSAVKHFPGEAAGPDWEEMVQRLQRATATLQRVANDYEATLKESAA